MKNVIKLFVVSLVLLAVSCTRSSDSGNPADIAASGTWRVTLFIDSGNDETADFAGYSFAFNSNGNLTATRSGNTQAGTWSVQNSSSKFIIDLGPKIDTNKPLGELTDDWKIISSSNTEIKLTDDNPASNEFVTFTKN